jgi:hypothetical protein
MRLQRRQRTAFEELRADRERLRQVRGRFLIYCGTSSELMEDPRLS